MRWYILAAIEIATVIGLASLMAWYTKRPAVVYPTFLLLAVWELVKELRKGG